MIDMYYGDGKENPPMTTRVRALEDAIERLSGYGKAIVVMLISLILKGLWDLLMSHGGTH